MTLLKEIPVNSIFVNPDQPRSVFNRKSQKELAASIVESGLLYPISVEGPHQPTEEIPHEFYILIDGERRLRSVRLLGWPKIEALVNNPVEISREKRFILSLVANLQRDDLSPIEEAKAFKRMKTDLGMKVLHISRKTGSSIEHINNRLRMLELEEEIQDLIDHGDIQKDKRLIEALLTIEESEKRVDLAKALAARGASVRAGVEACEKLNRHIRAEKISRRETPAIRIATIKAGPITMPKYDVFVEAGTLPKWEMVKESAKKVCDACAMRSIASEVVCRECPLAEFLIEIIKRTK